MQSCFIKRASRAASGPEIHKPASLLCLAGLASALTLAAPAAWAGHSPFSIDGTIPDAGAEAFEDPFGSVQELGPVNGATTKIGVIHGAANPMLAFTNPNGQTDLVTIWLDTAEDANGDTWLYFAWRRDANSGSSVITYEFQKAALPLDCDYTGDVDWVEPASADENALIADCNPWSARQSGDFLVVWDFKGGATDIILRTFDGMAFDVDALDATVSEAELNADTSRGEGAINLSKTVFQAGTCTSIGSVITGTVTGNSDSADYKDTVFADVVEQLTVSNCGIVKIRKETAPDGQAGSFPFTHNLAFVPADPTDTGFSLSDDGIKTYSSVVAPGTGYFVDETDPGPTFKLTNIDCSASDAGVSITSTVLADGRVTFDLDRGETLDCTFTNSLRPKVTLTKVVAVGNAGPNDFSLTQNGNGVTSGQTVTYDVGNTVSINETQVAGYEFVDITGHAKCPSALGGSTAALAAGDDITCTITNTLKPKVTLVKVVAAGAAVPNDFALTQNAVAVTSGQAVTHNVGATVTLDETQLAGYEFVSLTGDTKCPSALGGSTAALAAGDDITCTITNTLKPRVTLIKSVTEGDAAPDDFALTQNGSGVSSGQTVTYDVGATVTLNESQLPGYGFVSITGHAKCPSALGGATAALAGGDNVTCTITNSLQEGAIRIRKTRKYAAAADDAEFDGNANDEPHPGVTFTISGGSLDSPVEVVTGDDGEACLDDLAFSAADGDYTVTETVPTGYVSDDDEKTVSIDQVGTCDGGGEELVTFVNTPLTDVTVTAGAQDPDATRSRINCYQATMDGAEITLGDPIAENEAFADDVTVELDDQLPGYPDSLIVCTIEIDP